MDFYMYKSVCPGRLYGNTIEIKHVVVPPNTEEHVVTELSTKKANSISGSSKCKVQLLQKYLMSIEATKSYVGLTSLQFDGDRYDAHVCIGQEQDVSER
jgi:hypothetical protein